MLRFAPSPIGDMDIEETGDSFKENAIIKAEAINKALKNINYKTKDLRFKNELDKSSESLQLKTTHQNHLKANNDIQSSSMKLYQVDGLEEQNDGNNVNLDTQMSQQAQNTMMFTAIQNSIKKDSTWFKTMIDSSSKN